MTAALAYSRSFETSSWTMQDAIPVMNADVVGILDTLRKSLNSQTRKMRTFKCEELVADFEDEYKDAVSHLDEDLNADPLAEASNLLKALPDDIPLPSLIAEPDGTVGMEWYKDRRNAFVIAVKGDKTLEFASVYGFGNRQYGKVSYLDSLPRDLAIDLKRFLRR